jgi:hypothetical protein
MPGTLYACSARCSASRRRADARTGIDDEWSEQLHPTQRGKMPSPVNGSKKSAASPTSAAPATAKGRDAKGPVAAGKTRVASANGAPTVRGATP